MTRLEPRQRYPLEQVMETARDICGHVPACDKESVRLFHVFMAGALSALSDSTPEQNRKALDLKPSPYHEAVQSFNLHIPNLLHHFFLGEVEARLIQMFKAAEGSAVKA